MVLRAGALRPLTMSGGCRVAGMRLGNLFSFVVKYFRGGVSRAGLATATDTRGVTWYRFLPRRAVILTKVRIQSHQQRAL